MPETRVRSEIAGSVWKIEVAIGDKVAEDDPLIVLESMKMEIPLLSLLLDEARARHRESQLPDDPVPSEARLLRR